jgi:methionyl-tRNA formyltransferase
MKRDLRIIFMGTPQFAVPSLKSLIDNGFNVVGVITAPDKPAGRGREIKFSEVKQFAVKAKLPLLQPVNLKDNKFIKEFAALKPNLGIVVAFRMLPEEIWSFPEFGTFNLHASLLPQYRGAAPINHAIINGEKVTGLTTFFIKHEIDTGKIIFRNSIKIGEQETYGELHDRMMLTGAELVLKTAFAIQDNSYDLISQSDLITTDEIIKSAPKINESVIAHFYGLHKLNISYYGGSSTIIPLPLNVFLKMIEDSHKASYVPEPKHVRAFFEYSNELVNLVKSEIEWYHGITEKALNWLPK